MPSETSVAARRDGRVGRILLNRPQALNALDLAMIRACAEALQRWREDPAIHAVVIEGAGDRAFCAGGDIRAIRQFHLDGRGDRAEAFFSEEYELNFAIATCPKPYIALIDGICMGGGIGLSVHGAHRVATEHALFAMPETGIGFFPDIGGTYLLPRLPGQLGLYLALSGARIKGADAVHAGLATQFTPRAGLAELSRALAEDGPAALARHAAPLPPFSLAPQRAVIDRCFAADSMPGVMHRLEQDGGAFARQTAETLRAMSPSALTWSLKLLRLGAARTLRQCLDAELRATRGVTSYREFIEGVRAMVVDKDRRPNWQPARIEDVDPAEVDALLDYTGRREDRPMRDRIDAFRGVDEQHPGLPARTDDSVVALPHASAEVVTPEIVPDVLHGIEFGRAGRQRSQGEVVRDSQPFARRVPVSVGDIYSPVDK